MFRQQLRAILRASAYGKVRLLIPMVAHLSEVTPDARRAGARAPAARRRAARRTDRRRARRDDRGAGRRADAAGVPAPLRLRLDRHQRPDPVHAGDRPRRRVGGASLRPVASGGAAADRADDRAGASRQARTSASAARWPATPTFTELLLGMGLRSFSMHPSQIASVKQRVLATDAQRLGAQSRTRARRRRSGARMRGASRARLRRRAAKPPGACRGTCVGVVSCAIVVAALHGVRESLARLRRRGEVRQPTA